MIAMIVLVVALIVVGIAASKWNHIKNFGVIRRGVLYRSAQPSAHQVAVLSAPKWTTPRSISLTGDVTGSAATVDGSANVSIATTIAGGTAPKFFAGDVPAGTACVVTHSLNTRDVHVDVYANSGSYDTVLCDVERTSTTTVTLRFAAAVTAGQYRAVVIGR